MLTIGRLQYQIFTMIPNQAITTTSVPNIPVVSLGCGCDEVLKVLADSSGIELQNDKRSFLWWFNQSVVDAEIKLQKWENNAWVDYTASSGTYGTYYDFAFFTNDANENFIGLQLQWALVLDDLGEGAYRIKCTSTDILAAEVSQYSQEYCLKTYTPTRANGTIRIEYYLNGTLGINSDDTKVKDLGSLNWYNQIRLGGYILGSPKSTYQETRIAFNNGQNVFVTDEQTPEYSMKLKPCAEFIHSEFRTDIMMADVVLFTDYNAKNTLNLVKKRLYKNSGYEPQYKPLQSKLAGVEVKWIQEFNNHKKLRY